MKLSIICPTKNNLDEAIRLAEKLKDLAKSKDSYEIILVVDTNDKSYRKIDKQKLNIRICKCAPKKTNSERVITGINHSNGQVIMLLNDDVTPKTQFWDEIILKTAEKHADQIYLVHCNDGYFKQSLSIFPIFSRKFYDLSQNIFCRSYKKYRLDDSIFHVFNMLTYLGYNREYYIDSLIFKHNHFSITKENHEYRPIEKVHLHDTNIFINNKKQRLKAVKKIISYIKSGEAEKQLTSSYEKVVAFNDHDALRGLTRGRQNKPIRPTILVCSADSRSQLFKDCYDSLKKNTSNFDLVVLDNNNNHKFNHASEINKVLKTTKSNIFVTLDDDVLTKRGWLKELLKTIECPKTAVVTPVHFDKDMKFSYSGIAFSPQNNGDHSHMTDILKKDKVSETICSACVAVDTTKLSGLFFDENYRKYFFDLDYGLMAWELGFIVKVSARSRIIHYGGGTMRWGSERSLRTFQEDKDYFVKKWFLTGRYEKVINKIAEVADDRYLMSLRVKHILQNPPESLNRRQFLQIRPTIRATPAYGNKFSALYKKRNSYYVYSLSKNNEEDTRMNCALYIKTFCGYKIFDVGHRHFFAFRAAQLNAKKISCKSYKRIHIKILLQIALGTIHS